MRAVTADPAFRPRMRLSAGCQLQEVPVSEVAPTGVSGFGIATLGGQLRWGSETGPVIGDLSFPKGLERLRSAGHSFDHQFTMYCDAPLDVLSRLEAERGGAPPVFWMDLAGSWALDGGIEPIYQRPWQFVVPIDMWLTFLSASGYGEFDVVEVRRVLKEGGSLQAAVDYLNAARELVSSQPSKAVGICRLVLEAAEEALKDQGSVEIAEHLTACTDERRGKHYNRIVSSLKQLAGLEHHHFGPDSAFTPAEALTLVRFSEALLLLLGALAPLSAGR